MEYKMTVERLAELGIIFSRKAAAEKLAEEIQTSFKNRIIKEVEDHKLIDYEIEAIELYLEEDESVSQEAMLDYIPIIESFWQDINYELVKYRDKIKGVYNIPEYDISGVNLDKLNLSSECYKSLKHASCKTIGDALNKANLHRISDFPPGCISEYKKAVISYMENRVRNLERQL